MAVSPSLLFHPESSYLAIMELGEKEGKKKEKHSLFCVLNHIEPKWKHGFTADWKNSMEGGKEKHKLF